jgi:hypothetical protein
MAQVYLDTDGDPNGVPILIGRARMQRLAKHWHFVMRSRRRWIDNPELAKDIQDRAVRHLDAIGVKADALEKIAAQGAVQISITESASSPTQTTSDPGWEARLIPWEYLLCAATKKYRNHPLIVVRHLRDFISKRPVETPVKAVFVQCAPGALRDAYDFSIERRVLQKHLEENVEWQQIEDPTLQSITTGVQHSPHIVHVSGLDNYQGARILDPEQTTMTPESIKDGMYLRDDKWNAVPVEAPDLAIVLTSGAQKPAMISFNLYNSSARIAAFAVKNGAAAALGFQDYIDDSLAEIFFANFYWYWRLNQWDLLTAFERTMGELSDYKTKLRGTGIVLWSAQPLVGPNAVARSKPLEATAPRREQGPIQDLLETDITPHKRLNYSLLHNGTKPLFDSFSIYKYQQGSLGDVEVEVELQIGNERFPYKRTLEMRHHVMDLSEEIGVGLTSDLARSLRESVQATMFGRVSVGRKQIFGSTFLVTLLPVDEWRDDGINHIWLPSFVLPRDPAVLDVIVKAQRYLMALRDDAFAGFDGYQSIENDSIDTDAVDDQVRAIWYAILHDFSLSYINPPPSFTDASQRLRTPSDTLRGGRGTCIDLALLMASCLEFIDIRPAVILLDGHAFPAYWSTERSHKAFLVTPSSPLMEQPANPTPLPDEEEEREETESFAQKLPWEFDKSRYQEVFEAVKSGDLVPLETTMLTNRGSFWDAIDEGVNNLREPEEFYSMLDIRLARENGVTPLPLSGERRG